MAAAVAVRVGELACQKNSFLRELTATVVSCEPAKVPANGGSKKKENAADGPTLSYDVVMSDSVLFPEGGGQPCDHGVLRLSTDGAAAVTEIAITSVRRVGDTCVLTSPAALPVGGVVHQTVDWPRRLDHMQHHTGQHLLTAVVERADTMHLPTVSWSLTHPFCFIQVDVGACASDPSSPYHAYITKEKKICDEMVAKIEDLCNEAMAQSTPVQCDTFDTREAYQQDQERRKAAASPENGEAFRSRGIPEDVTGPIRIISIPHVDSCTCCGTHLHTLAELQAFHLLHQEVKGTTVKLYFVTGARAITHFRAMYQRERQLMPELGGSRPEDFVTVVQRRSKDANDAEKGMKRWTLELATSAAQSIIAMVSAKKSMEDVVVVPLRRDDVELGFFTEVRQQLDAAGLRRVVLVAAWTAERCVTTSITPSTAAVKEVPGQVFINGGLRSADLEKPVELAKATLEGLKGGTSKFGFRGKGNLKEWDALVRRLAE